MQTVLFLEDMQTSRREARRLVPGRQVLIGRGEEACLRLRDSSVARVHARLMLHEGHLWVEDLGSSSGTWLASRPLLPGIPEHWQEGQDLHLGPRFVLSLSRAPSDQLQAPVLGLWTVGDAPDEPSPLSPWAERAVEQARADTDAARASGDDPRLGEPPAPARPPEAMQEFPFPSSPGGQTLSLDPRAVAAMQESTSAPPGRLFGATAVMAAARPEPAAGSLTFSGFAPERAGWRGAEVLPQAAQESPLESGGRRGARGTSGRRSSARDELRGSKSRRRVVRQKRSLWPFALLGVLTLGLGGVASSLIMKHRLPWAPEAPETERDDAPDPEAPSVAVPMPAASSPAPGSTPHAVAARPAPSVKRTRVGHGRGRDEQARRSKHAAAPTAR